MYHGHATVKFNKKIAVKTERDIEIRLRVKSEPKMTASVVPLAHNKKISIKIEGNMPKVNALRQQPQQLGWQEEKQTLIHKLVALKAENNKHLLNLKKTESENSKLLLQNQKLNENLSACNSQINKLKSKLIACETEISELKSNAIKTNNQMKAEFEREKKMLIDRVQQSQIATEKKQTITSRNSNAENEYEVDAILNDKKTRSGHKYLIRWKNYGPDEDTWEREDNLNCPTILAQYKISKQK